MNTSSSVMGRQERRFSTASTEQREQRRHSPMHLPDRQPPAFSLSTRAIDTRQREQVLLGQRGIYAAVDCELDDVFGAQRGNQLARRAERNDAAMIHDRNAIAESRRFLHVVGGEKHRPSARLQSLDNLPRLMPRLRVEPGRGLIEEQQLRIADQRAPERQPLLLSAREIAHVIRGLLFETNQSKHFWNALAPRVEAAEERDDLDDAQLLGELRFLKLNAKAGA
jgi:hypothetical protein